MFFEFMSRLVALDIGWIFSLVMASLLPIFLFYSVMHIVLGGRNVLFGFLLVVAIFFISEDFTYVLGFPLLIGAFLLPYYISKLAVLGFAENNKFLKNKLVVVNTFQYATAILIFIIFMAGA